MKGFLSFLGITLITVAFGSILLLFYGNPIEELKNQERQQAYQEMRAHHSVVAENNSTLNLLAQRAEEPFYFPDGQVCTRLSFGQ